MSARMGPYRPAAAEKHFTDFAAAAQQANLVPVYTRLTSDQLTPVTAYRCLVKDGDFEVPSFLFESVQNGTDTGRFSFVGAQPALEILAKGNEVTVLDHKQVRHSMLATLSSSKGSMVLPFRHPLYSILCCVRLGCILCWLARARHTRTLRFEDRFI